MFKHVGNVAPLALCLFAIVIVMGSCDRDPPITPPTTVDPQVDPPMERFTGTLPVPDDDELRSLAWNPQGSMLAAGFWGGLWLYDTATGEAVHVKAIKGEHEDGVDKVAWGNSLFIVTNDVPSEVQIWDAATGEHLKTTINEVEDSVWFSPDGSMIATDGYFDLVLKDTGTGQVLRTLPGKERFRTLGAAFSPDGSTIAAFKVNLDADDMRISLYDVTTGGKTSEITYDAEFNYRSRAAGWNSDGSLLAAVCYDGTVGFIEVWDSVTGQPEDPDSRIASGIDWVIIAAWSPTTPSIIAIGGREGRIELWDIATDQILKTITTGYDYVRFLEFSPDGRTLAIGDLYGPYIRLWDVSDVSR